MWNFCAALRTFAGYRRRVFRVKLPQSQEFWLISRLPCFHLLTVSFCWMCPSLDCYLKSIVLYNPPLSTDTLFVLCDVPSFPHFWEISPSASLCRFRAKTDKEILWPAPKQTDMNAIYCITFWRFAFSSQINILAPVFLVDSKSS